MHSNGNGQPSGRADSKHICASSSRKPAIGSVQTWPILYLETATTELLSLGTLCFTPSIPHTAFLGVVGLSPDRKATFLLTFHELSLSNTAMRRSQQLMLAGAWFWLAYLVNAKLELRALREIVTTTACRNIRQAHDYPARVDLVYIYVLDYVGNDNENNAGDDSLDLMGVERAIASSVASTLNRCDDERYPLYAVELSDASAHKVIATGA